jgi:CHAD domain-containing protein
VLPQLAPFAGVHHAPGVGVPAAAGVAFGGDQHVLAERGQLMAAERTAVRRGLAVLRAAHRPPPGRRKARGHSHIVAPSGLRPLAGALAVVGLGVGVALVRAQRERRSERPPLDPRARGKRRRRPSLLPGEPFAEGLRRVILGQLDLAVELLEGYPATTPRAGGPLTRPPAPAGDGEQTVHETRKALKRLRALLALLAPELGSKRYARERAALRDCARRLAGARDAEVMVGTLDALVQRHPARLARSAAVRALRAQLHAEREAAAALAIRDPRVRGEVLGELRAVRARVERWELRDRGFRSAAPGLERIYRRGRAGLRTARRRGGGSRHGKGRDRTAEALHAWRKRVKELRYAAETLDRGGSGPGASYTRRLARRADRLGEALGEEHDLALLEGRVRERSRHFAAERGTRKRLLALIARRRRSLRKAALREGERLYRRPPRRFVRRVRRTK